MPRHELMTFFEELHGPRVTLRGYHLDDAQAVYDAIMESKEELRPWLPFVPLYDKPDGMDELRAFIIRSQAEWLLRDNFNNALFRTEDGTFLGGIGLHPRNWTVPSFEIGYWLRTSATSQGYMTEAVCALTDYAFTVLGAQRIMIRCDARNHRSAAIPRRLGFVEEGCQRHLEPGPTPADPPRDILFFSLIPSDPRWP
jgi:ribosomal-protein-serine acetyltransferase